MLASGWVPAGLALGILDPMTLLVVELDSLDGVRQPRDHAPGLFVGDPARPPIHDVAVGVERAEVPSGGHISRVQLDVEDRRR